MQRGGRGGRGRPERGRGEARGGGRGPPRGDGGYGAGRGRFGGRGEGRGRGRGNFEAVPAERIGPPGEAQRGTAARPGTDVILPGTDAMERTLATSLSTITDSMKALSIRPRRPAAGKVGRKVTLKANHFKVACKLAGAVHYDVTVMGLRRGGPPGLGGGEAAQAQPPAGPERPLPASICRRVIAALAEQETWPQHEWAYDGQKLLYTARLFMPQAETVHEVEANDGESARSRLFRVTIKWAADVDVRALIRYVESGGGDIFPQEAIQCLDVVLRSTMSFRPDVVTFARGFFLDNRQMSKPIGNGAEVWMGYTQSLRAEQMGLALQMDMAVTAFLEPGPVIDFLTRAAGLHNPHDFARATREQIRKADRAISTIKVEVRRDGAVRRRYRAKGLTESKGPGDLVFYNEQAGRDMSVLEYFEQTYHIPLLYPEVPCVNAGTPRKPVWLPPELLFIVKAQRRLKLDERQTAEIIKTAAAKPADRMGFIEACVNQHASLPQDPTLAAFQMRLEGRMVTVDGRHLPPPELMYDRPVRPEADKGAWNAQNVRFVQPMALTSFAVASFVRPQRAGGPVNDPGSINAVFAELLGACRNNGMSLPPSNLISPAYGLPEQLVVYSDPRNQYVGQTLEQAYEAAVSYFKKVPDILFVILPERGTNDAYKEVKRATDSHLGVPSQCLHPTKASVGMPPRRFRQQYCGNVAMKINAKLNGVNHRLHSVPYAWMRQPFIVFGADVTHPVGFAPNIPSVAAVVASMDPMMGRFATRIMLQAHRQEILLGLKDVVKELLIEFVRANKGTKPARIIFFRDGVSEGEFLKVQEAEIPQVFAAVAELQRSEAAGIPITYIVCQKRHMTRLFPGERGAGDRNGNVLPGTVVDSMITDPRDFNFFLNSHASIQGTSRPARYYVLLDQNRMGADEVQHFAYWSTYTFCRCTRSVSLPPAVYYAHLAAFRGRILVSDIDSDAESATTAGTAEGPIRVEFAQVNENLKTRMFYV